MLELCKSCGGMFDRVDGATHEYMHSSVGCWHAYGQILAREYSDHKLFTSVHRLTVNAYALQHPGLVTEKRAYQSVRIHYVSLHLIFRYNYSHSNATLALKKLAGGHFEPLPDRPDSYALTVEDMLKTDEVNHVREVKAWAKCAYKAWASLTPFAENYIKYIRD